MVKASVAKKSPTEVPEVDQFMEAERRLAHFREEHADIFGEFDELVEDYNQKLEAADKVCRAQRISCGPFDLYQEQLKYDAKVLFDAVGRERFLQVGGVIKTTTIYDIDKARIEASISQNLIPADIVKSFKELSARFHKPKKMEI